MLFAFMNRLLSLAAVALAISVFAQQPTQQPKDLPPPVVNETVSVGYVMIPFTVLGEQNRPLTDLRGGEVNLLVDGIPVPNDMFEKSQGAPVSFTILIDGSGSMALAGKMDAAFAAIGALLAHRRPGDDFSLWLFADAEAHELVASTEHPPDITKALAPLKPYGKKPFFDALAPMPEHSFDGRNPTRAF